MVPMKVGQTLNVYKIEIIKFLIISYKSLPKHLKLYGSNFTQDKIETKNSTLQSSKSFLVSIDRAIGFFQSLQINSSHL